MKNYDHATLTIGEAAELLGVHIDTVRNWEKRGYLIAIKTPGGHRRFLASDIESLSRRSFMPAKHGEESAAIKEREHVLDLDNLDESRRSTIAILEENQRLANEMTDSVGDLAQFVSVSSAMIYKIFSTLRCFDLVSVQPMLRTSCLIHYAVNDEIFEESVCCVSRKLKTIWHFYAQQDLRGKHNVEMEEQLISILAEEIRIEFDRMISFEISNNAAIKKTIRLLPENSQDRFETIRQQTIKTAQELKDLYNSPPSNWLIISSDMKEVFGIENKNCNSLGLEKVGAWKTNSMNVAVYCDPLSGPGSITLGYKGENFDVGYVFSPYIPLLHTPIVLNEETFIPHRGLISMFSTKVVNPAYYATLDVSGSKLENISG